MDKVRKRAGIPGVDESIQKYAMMNGKEKKMNRKLYANLSARNDK